MKRKMYSLILLCLFSSIFTFAQTKVITTNGETFIASDIELNDENLIVKTEGKSQTILKSDVLAVVPKGKSAYTFWIKNGKKLKFKSKDIKDNYTGTDIPRIFAYKYDRRPSNISQLYALNSDNKLSEEEFTKAFKDQKSKMSTRNVVGISLALFALILGASSLSSSLSAI